MQSTSLYTLQGNESNEYIFGIKFYEHFYFEKIATTKKTIFFDTKFLGQANTKNSFWLTILKFGQNHLKALTLLKIDIYFSY